MEAELVAIANATTVNRANTAIGVIKTAAAAKGRTVLRKSERIVNDAVLAISKNATVEPISFKYVLPDVPFKKQKAAHLVTSQLAEFSASRQATFRGY